MINDNAKKKLSKVIFIQFCFSFFSFHKKASLFAKLLFNYALVINCIKSNHCFSNLCITLLYMTSHHVHTQEKDSISLRQENTSNSIVNIFTA